MTSTRPNQPGFTLIELLLYVSIIGSLLLAVSLFFALTTAARIKHQAITEVNQQGVAAMDHITQTIRNANLITTPLIGTSGSTLTLVVPTPALSPTTFSLAGTTLQVAEGLTPAVALTSSRVQVSNLTFKNLSRLATPGNVQVTFTVTHVNSLGRPAYDYQKTFTSSAEVGW